MGVGWVLAHNESVEKVLLTSESDVFLLSMGLLIVVHSVRSFFLNLTQDLPGNFLNSLNG